MCQIDLIITSKAIIICSRRMFAGLTINVLKAKKDLKWTAYSRRVPESQ